MCRPDREICGYVSCMRRGRQVTQSVINLIMINFLYLSYLSKKKPQTYQKGDYNIKIETIAIPILVALVSGFIAIRYKEISQKREKFNNEYSDFTDSFLEFIECLESKTIGLNSSILSEFLQHRRAKDVFIHNLKGLRRWRFNKKWAEYEEEYNEVADRDVFTRYAAIAPNREALEKATSLDAEQWEIDRKKKIHRILNQLFKISKRNIWL